MKRTDRIPTPDTENVVKAKVPIGPVSQHIVVAVATTLPVPSSASNATMVRVSRSDGTKSPMLTERLEMPDEKLAMKTVFPTSLNGERLRVPKVAAVGSNERSEISNLEPGRVRVIVKLPTVDERLVRAPPLLVPKLSKLKLAVSAIAVVADAQQKAPTNRDAKTNLPILDIGDLLLGGGI